MMRRTEKEVARAVKTLMGIGTVRGNSVYINTQTMQYEAMGRVLDRAREVLNAFGTLDISASAYVEGFHLVIDCHGSGCE